MGEGFQFIDIVLFAMIAAFLILRLRGVLGRHRDHGRPEDGGGGSRSPQRDDNVISLPEQAETTPAVDDGLNESGPPPKETPITGNVGSPNLSIRSAASSAYINSLCGLPLPHIFTDFLLLILAE